MGKININNGVITKINEKLLQSCEGICLKKINNKIEKNKKLVKQEKQTSEKQTKKNKEIFDDQKKKKS